MFRYGVLVNNASLCRWNFLLPPFLKGVRGIRQTVSINHKRRIILFYNTKLKGQSRRLRKSMTDTERLLWSKIRGKQLKGYQFYRQRIIGNYIVDFYCPKAKLVIEIDGGQHYAGEELKKDKIRDDYMREHELKVLRASDREVFENLNGVVDRIYDNM
jgi:very-short-patch-repair endonuclease